MIEKFSGCMMSVSIVALLFSFVLPISPAFGDEAALKARFLEEAPRGWERLKELTTHLEGRGELFEADPKKGDGRQWRRTSRWKFKINGALFRVEEERLDEQENFAIEKAGVANSKYFFFLARDKSAAPWVLTSHVEQGGNGRAVDPVLIASKGGVLTYLPAAWSITDVPLAELIRDPNFTLQRVSELEYQGRPCVAVDFAYRPKMNLTSKDPKDRSILMILKGSRIILDPARSWSVQKVELDAIRGIAGSLIVDYEQERNGLPIIRRLTSEAGNPNSGINVKAEFHDLEFKDTPESAFTLSAYGLPEPQGVVWDHDRSRYDLWLVAAGLLTLLTAAGLRLLVRRKAVPEAGSA